MAVWDVVQQMQLRGLRKAAALNDAEALQRDRRQEERVDKVDDRLEQLQEVIEALWTVLVEKTGCTEDDLVRALDDVQDRHEAARAVVPCAKCGAAMRRSDHHCQFCGAAPPPLPGQEPPAAIDRFTF